MSSAISGGDLIYKTIFELEIDEAEIELTVPRPVLDIRTRDFVVLNAPVPIISRNATEILYRPVTISFDSPFLASALDRGAFARETQEEIDDGTLIEARSRVFLDQRIETIAGGGGGGGGGGLDAFDVREIIRDVLPPQVLEIEDLEDFILETLFGFRFDDRVSGRILLLREIRDQIDDGTIIEARDRTELIETIEDNAFISVAPSAETERRLIDRIETVIQREVNNPGGELTDRIDTLEEDVDVLEDQFFDLRFDVDDIARREIRDLVPEGLLTDPGAYIYQELTDFLLLNADEDKATDIRGITLVFISRVAEQETLDNLSEEAAEIRQ